MSKPEAPQPGIVDRILHRGPATGHTPTAPHAGHPFVGGGTQRSGRGAGGWVWMDDSSYEAHVCAVCGHPEADPHHSVEDADQD